MDKLMLDNSDELPVIFKCRCWYILPVFTILLKYKIKIWKICNMIFFMFYKK